MKLNDLQDKLDINIDIKKNFIEKKLKIDKLGKTNIVKDINLGLKNINLEGKKYISISNNKEDKLDINILKKERKIDLRYINIINKTIIFLRKIFNKKIIVFNKKEGLFFKKKKNQINYFLKISLFIIFLLFILYLDKLLLIKYVNSGYNKLISIKDDPSNIKFLKKQLNDAKFDFLISNILFKPFLIFKNNNKAVENGYNIISGGKEITKLGDNFLNIIALTKVFISHKGIENTYLTNLLNNLKKDFLSTEKGLNKALFYYNQISGLDNAFLEEKLKNNIGKLTLLKEYIELINTNLDTILNIMGQNKEKKYLVVFQNSDEIRPTGGFMGSMGIITLFRGKVKHFEKKDVYELEWDLKKADYSRVKAPKGIIELTEKFGLRDSNYFVNLKDSSENIKFFIEKSGNNIDGIIYLNQNILLEFLEDTGGVKVDGITEEITSKNFSEIMSILVEAKIFKKGTLGTPKKILFDFMEVFFAKLKQEKKYTKYGKILLDNLNKRELLFYSFNESENKIFEALGLGGKIKYSNSLDFTYPVFTSLSGNKSDRYKQLKYKKNIVINNDCSIETDFSIYSTHFYSKTKEKQIGLLFDKYNINRTSSLLDIQGRGDNYQFVRILLPKEAIIKKSDKYTIEILSDKKMVELFIRTKRLETSVETISYKIMNNTCRKYNYILYKQPGIREYDLEISENGKKIENFGINRDYYYNLEK